MNIRKSINLLSGVLVAGFLLGLVPAIVDIVSNRYFQFKAYRLIALGFSGHWNRALTWGGGGVILFCLAWFLIRMTVRTDPDRTTRIAVGLTVLSAISLLCVHLHLRGIQGYSVYARKFGYLRHGFNRLLTGDVSLGRVLHLNPAKLGIIAAVLAASAALVFLAIAAIKGMGRIPWGRLLATIDRPAGILRASAAGAVLITAAMNLAASSPGRRAPSAQLPNVVWITIDALRADHLGCYGYAKNTSPFIDSLAENGILFQWAIAQESYTHASVPSFFTSTYAFEHGSLHDHPRIDRLDPRFLTVAEALKNAGYGTAAFVFNPHLYAHYNLDQGFDLYADRNQQREKHDRVYWRSETAMRIHDAVGGYLALRKDRPLFFYLHYRDVHEPYSPPPPFHESFLPEGAEPDQDGLSGAKAPQDPDLIEFRISQYDGEILYTDTILERTFALFRKHGLRPDNTIFIITADHGEEFLDKHPGDAGGISHGRTLYNELIRVPLIISLPDSAGGKAIGTAVELNDILPTLVDVLALRISAGRQCRGRSLMPLVRGEDVPGRPVISGGRGKRGAIIEDGWKYIRLPLGEKGSPGDVFREELYDLRSDPGETVDLIDRESARAARMRERLLEVQNSPWTVGRPRSVRLDRKTEEELRSLGYIK